MKTDNNTQLPDEVENAIIKESYDKYNLVRQGGEREAYREGAIEYASKLHQAQQEIESLTNQLKGHASVSNENMKLLRQENEKARTLLQKVVEKYSRLYEWNSGIFNEIKQFLDGKKYPIGRAEFIRKQAIDTLELTKGFTPEQRQSAGNSFHTMEVLAGYILELTDQPPAEGERGKETTVFIPCEDDDPRCTGGYTSSDGQCLCHVRETTIQAIGTMWMTGDYHRLYDQLKAEPERKIVCWVDYSWGLRDEPKEILRDICAIMGRVMGFNARGIGYGGVELYIGEENERSEFIEECERLHVQWLDESEEKEVSNG